MEDSTAQPSKLTASTKRTLLTQPRASDLFEPVLVERSVSNRDARTWDHDPRPGDVAFRWFQQNMASLTAAYPGMWVSIVQEHVTASAPTSHEAYVRAAAQGQSGAFIGYVPEGDEQNRTLIL